MLDKNGQPVNTRFNARLREDHEVDELVGLCKGVVADGMINQQEAEFLLNWLELSRESQDAWPANVLFPRIRSMLQDNKLDDNEEKELLSILIGITGGNAGKLNVHSLSVGLPLDVPAPQVVVRECSFCFTGKFLLGNRNQCQDMVIQRGGMVANTITKELNFLVLGLVGSRDWAHSTFGRKIEKAVEYRTKGQRPAIISEEHFANSLSQI